MTIQLAANRIPYTNFGHLQLVYGSYEIEVQAPFILGIPFGGKWKYTPDKNVFTRNHFDPDNTPNVSFSNTNDYTSSAINLGGRSDEDVWTVLKNIHMEFIRQDNLGNSIDYNVDQNSNSYVNTLMYMIGSSVEGYDYSPWAVTAGFPGVETNVMFRDDIFDFNLSLSKGNDFINMGKGDDVVRGMGGNDTINTWDGNDRIETGGTNIISGKDLISAGIGNDYVKSYAENDTIRGGDGDDKIYGGDGNDEISGDNNNDLIYGESGNDSLVGGEGNDTIYGGNGNDTIIGGAGADNLFGGAGADIFIFNNISESSILYPDIISDFKSGVDKINLSELGFVGLDKDGGLTEDGELRYFGSSDLISDQVDFRINFVSGFTPLENDFTFWA